MSRIPSLLAEGRTCDVVLVALSGVGQGAALGIVALATRDLFAAMHGSRDPAFATFALLGVAGCAVVGLATAQSRPRGDHWSKLREIPCDGCCIVILPE